jgi:hypothetical protein
MGGRGRLLDAFVWIFERRIDQRKQIFVDLDAKLWFQQSDINLVTLGVCDLPFDQP